MLDSIQTVRARQTLRDVPSIRERVMGNARIARRLAVEHGLAMLYTSEVNRSWYLSRREEDRASDLAAFAEARIEFSADMLLTMRAMDEDPDLVEIRIPKNRLGTRQGFLLRLDRTRARFDEVDGNVADATRSAADAKRIEEAVAEILRTLRDTPGLTSTQLQGVLAIKKATFTLAMQRVRKAGFVRLEKQGKCVLHYLAEVPK